jgi:hypothetical protein
MTHIEHPAGQPRSVLTMRSYEAYSPYVVEEEFLEDRIAPVQHPCPLAEVVDLRGLSSLLGA